MGFAQDREGTIWAATKAGWRGWTAIDGRKWGKTGISREVLPTHPFWIVREHFGFLPRTRWFFFHWARETVSTDGYSSRPGNTNRASANGKLWMAETTRSVRPIPLSDKRLPPDETEVQVGSQGILFDNDGALWITSLGDGLRRSQAPGSAERQNQGIQHRGRVVHREGWIKRRFCPRHSSGPRRKYLGRNQQRSGSLPQNEPGTSCSPLQALECCFGCRRLLEMSG
jgi:hypothetical protein